MKHLAAGLGCIFLISVSTLRAQDGANYDPAAAAYRSPTSSLDGPPDLPEELAALASFWTGDTALGIAKLKERSALGSVRADLFLGDVYRQKSELKIDIDPDLAKHFYELASAKGSGEASERIAEMLEHREVPSAGDMGAADWRALAVRQGWIQQQLAMFCISWAHGPEALHCDPPPPSPGTDPLVADACPSAAEMKLLRAAGITGTIGQLSSAIASRSAGPTAKAILIMDRPVSHEQDLKEPYGTSVVYVQIAGEKWQMIPANTPLLDRYIVLTPNGGGRGSTGALAQGPDGSSGTSCGPIPQGLEIISTQH